MSRFRLEFIYKIQKLKIFVNMKLILASSSPRRIELLKKIVTDFEIKIPQNEEVLDYSKNATINTQKLATQKAREVFEKNSFTLGFDTLGELDGKPFGKPENEKSAIALLQKLSGKTHSVASSFCAKNDVEEIVGSEIAHVTFRDLANSEIKKYVQENPVTNFAGAYAIQGEAKKFVAKLDGDIETVIGFPMKSIQKILDA
jgi:septum formation protein